MRLIKKLIILILANGAALYLADRYVAGFHLPLDFSHLALAALILTAVNVFVRPILKIALWPILILTLGLGGLLINALAILILDALAPYVTISGLIPLAYTTLIVSALNVAVTIITK